MILLRGISWQVAPLLSLALVAGIWADRQLFHRPVGDAEAYHAKVRVAASGLPSNQGEWVGSEIEVVPAAQPMSQPNVLLGRRFRHASTGESADVVVVQCRDVRDLHEYTPRRRYAALGWTLRETRRSVHSVRGTTLPGTLRRFTTESAERYSEAWVYSLSVRPSGATRGNRAARTDPRMKGFGAGQVQVVSSTPMSEDRMDLVFNTLVSWTLPVIDAIRERGVQ